MKDYDTLIVNKKGNVVTATLHRPDSKNAIDIQMLNDLSDLMEQVEDSDDVDVLVLNGDGDIFCSGIDLSAFSSEKAPDVHGIHKWEKMCRQLERLDKFTVAAVNGDCTGGGAQLVLACDARIGTTHSKIQLNEVKLGFLPGMATFRIAKYIGLGRAKNLILTGKTITGTEAQQLGILDEVCDHKDFEALLESTIKSLLPFNPIALQMGRRLLNESYAETYEDFLGDFLAAQHRCINSDSFNKLVVAAKKTKTTE